LPEAAAAARRDCRAKVEACAIVGKCAAAHSYTMFQLKEPGLLVKLKGCPSVIHFELKLIQ